MMNPNYCIPFFMFLLSIAFQNDAVAQSIRGDTIYVDANSVVAVFFPASPSKAELSDNDGQEGMYKVSVMGKKSLSILALKKGVKDQDLEVTEGERKHLFILSYREGSPARSIDLSTKRKIADRVDIIRKDASKVSDEAGNLYEQAKKNGSDQALWEKAEAKYVQLLKIADPKDAGIARSRLEESRKQVQGIKEKKYDEEIKEGQHYLSLKKYGEARKAYQKALAHRPGDAGAMKNIDLIDSAWAKGYLEKGDEALRAKNYVLAKSNYQEALGIKPGYPFLQDKFDHARKNADPLIYKLEKKNGDDAVKANDIAGARKAYDSALSVMPDDRYVKDQLRKLISEEEKIAQEEKEEALYQGVLAGAKNAAGKASTVQDYDTAIKEYKRAADMMPVRKFPKKKIAELTRIRNGIRAN